LIEPKPGWQLFEATVVLIRASLELFGNDVVAMSRYGMGASLVHCFGVLYCANVISHIPYFIGDTIMRRIHRNHGRNCRTVVFTRDI
jgi:hypothetical protein